MLTQGVIELESGRYLAARKTMQLGFERVIASGRLDLIGPTHAVLVPRAAAAGDWEASTVTSCKRGVALRPVTYWIRTLPSLF